MNEASFIDAANAVLRAGDVEKKCQAALAASKVAITPPFTISSTKPPDRPARPEKPELAPPGEMPRRRFGSERGRATLLHAIAHIEFNAIDLAFDMAVRFAGEIHAMGLDASRFVTDWFAIGAEEALHFQMIARRLRELGYQYGDFPAHDGLWEAAQDTAGSVAARLVVAPMILEARGLDVTPMMRERLLKVGDEASAAILQKIFEDEIGHVAAGNRWFSAVCKVNGEDPGAKFTHLRQRHFNGQLKPPFNDDARSRAGLEKSYYVEN